MSIRAIPPGTKTHITNDEIYQALRKMNLIPEGRWKKITLILDSCEPFDPATVILERDTLLPLENE